MPIVLLLLLIATEVLAQRLNPGPGERPDPVRDAALKELIPLTTGLREDDHPAVASSNGKVWVVWVSYSEIEGSSQIYLRSLENGKWSEPVQVSEGPGDYHKPAIAIEGATVWVAWPAQVRGNWDIYGRIQKGQSWSKTERWTADPGPDTTPQLAASQGRVLLVWQGMRKDNLDILYRMHNGGWGQEGFVTESRANDWDPVVAASSTGTFYVAWDSYRGDYDVFLRSLTRSEWSAEIPIAASRRLENHPSLTVDARDRAWIAWEIGPENWASDSSEGGLRARRDIGLACYQNGKVNRAPEAEEAITKLAGEKGMQAPVVSIGREGKLRLFFRRPVNNNWLSVGTSVWEGNSWTTPEMLPNSEGRIDQRIVLVNAGEGTIVCYPAGSSHNVIYARSYGSGGLPASDRIPALSPNDAVPARQAIAPPVRHTLNGYQLVWGDLHRHTDISEDGGTIDGSLSDAMRYALDAAGLDFLGITDHTRYLPRRYNLWRIQQISDLYYKTGVFSPMHAYERSQYSPWGHRNIVHLNRDYVPVPASYDVGDPGVDPNGLFAALRGKKAISIPHTSAWGNKQVSWDYNDPDIERVVEIYQGLRSTYEYNGAPDPANRSVYEKDSKSFIWNALERKLKFGFIASSDHRSTHMSFAAVYAKGIDRESIFEGLRARRTYAATDKILLDVTIANHLMGEAIEVSGAPELEVAVQGTASIAQIEVIKNSKFVYAIKPGTTKARFQFRDQAFRSDDAYYYVRVIQSDKNMAWSSPIWVRRSN